MDLAENTLRALALTSYEIVPYLACGGMHGLRLFARLNSFLESIYIRFLGFPIIIQPSALLICPTLALCVGMETAVDFLRVRTHLEFARYGVRRSLSSEVIGTSADGSLIRPLASAPCRTLKFRVAMGHSQRTRPCRQSEAETPHRWWFPAREWPDWGIPRPRSTPP